MTEETEPTDALAAERLLLQGYKSFGENFICVYCGCIVPNAETRVGTRATTTHRERCQNGRMQ